MKLLVVALIALTGTTVFAADSVCLTKQKNAAVYELAQSEGRPVNAVKIEGVVYGAWTEAVGNNSGSDTVAVAVGGRIVDHIVRKSYVVGAKQVGTTEDCKITSVKEVRFR